MANVRNHGGGCCGMRHISGFNGHLLNKEMFNNHLAELLRNVPTGRLAEVVLTGGQLNGKQFVLDVLMEAGFKLVSRFTNGNTSNICNVFHRVSSPTSTPLPGWVQPTSFGVLNRIGRTSSGVVTYRLRSLTSGRLHPAVRDSEDRIRQAREWTCIPRNWVIERHVGGRFADRMD